LRRSLHQLVAPNAWRNQQRKNVCPCWVYPMYPSHTMQLSKKVPTYPRYPKYKSIWKDFRNINRWWVGSGVCSFRGLLRTILEIALIEKIDWWDPERKKSISPESHIESESTSRGSCVMSHKVLYRICSIQFKQIL